jgi:hypothetical protein
VLCRALAPLPSSNQQNIKKKYPLVLSRINQLCERIRALGPAASIDVDQAALRVTLDVIGLVGAPHWPKEGLRAG